MVLYVTPQTLAPNLRAFLGGGGNTLALLHSGGAMLFDTKLGDFALRVRREVQVDLGHRVQRILLTHWHIDHAGGLDAYPDVSVILAHPNTRARLIAAGSPLAQTRENRWVDVDHELQLWLDGEEVRILFLGAGHTDGDLIALLPAHRLLVTGDLFVSGLQPHVDEASGGSLLALRATLDRICQLDFDAVLPGHGPITDKAELVAERDYLVALERETRAQREQGATEAQAVKTVKLPEYSRFRDWFADSRAANVRRMFHELKAAKSAAP